MTSVTPSNNRCDLPLLAILPRACANILKQVAGVTTLSQLKELGKDGLKKINELSEFEKSQIGEECYRRRISPWFANGSSPAPDDNQEPTPPAKPPTTSSPRNAQPSVRQPAVSVAEQPAAKVKGGMMKLERVPILNKKISCVVRINLKNRRLLNQAGFIIIRHLVRRTKAEIMKETAFSDESMHAIGFQLAKHELSFLGEDWHTYLEGQRHLAKPSVPGATVLADFIPHWAIRKRLEGDGILTMEDLAERFPTLVIFRTKTRELIRQAIERFRAGGTVEDPKYWQPLAASVIIRPENHGATNPAPDDKIPPAITLVGSLTPTRQDGMTIGNLGEIKLDARFKIGDQPFELVLSIKPPDS